MASPRIDGVILPDSPELRAAQRERFENAQAAMREFSRSMPPRILLPAETVEAILADERRHHAEVRAAALARRQARRARRLSFEIPRPEWNSPTLPG